MASNSKLDVEDGEVEEERNKAAKSVSAPQPPRGLPNKPHFAVRPPDGRIQSPNTRASPRDDTRDQNIQRTQTPRRNEGGVLPSATPMSNARNQLPITRSTAQDVNGARINPQHKLPERPEVPLPPPRSERRQDRRLTEREDGGRDGGRDARLDSRIDVRTPEKTTERIPSDRRPLSPRRDGRDGRDRRDERVLNRDDGRVQHSLLPQQQDIQRTDSRIGSDLSRNLPEKYRGGQVAQDRSHQSARLNDHAEDWNRRNDRPTSQHGDRRAISPPRMDHRQDSTASRHSDRDIRQEHRITDRKSESTSIDLPVSRSRIQDSHPGRPPAGPRADVERARRADRSALSESSPPVIKDRELVGSGQSLRGAPSGPAHPDHGWPNNDHNHPGRLNAPPHPPPVNNATPEVPSGPRGSNRGPGTLPALADSRYPHGPRRGVNPPTPGGRQPLPSPSLGGPSNAPLSSPVVEAREKVSSATAAVEISPTVNAPLHPQGNSSSISLLPEPSTFNVHPDRLRALGLPADPSPRDQPPIHPSRLQAVQSATTVPPSLPVGPRGNLSQAGPSPASQAAPQLTSHGSSSSKQASPPTGPSRGSERGGDDANSRRRAHLLAQNLNAAGNGGSGAVQTQDQPSPQGVGIRGRAGRRGVTGANAATGNSSGSSVRGGQGGAGVANDRRGSTSTVAVGQSVPDLARRVSGSINEIDRKSVV